MKFKAPVKKPAPSGQIPIDWSEWGGKGKVRKPVKPVKHVDLTEESTEAVPKSGRRGKKAAQGGEPAYSEGPKSGPNDGHYTFKLAGPIEARKLRTGMTVISARGTVQTVVSVKPALNGAPFLLVTVRDEGKDVLLIPKPADRFFQRVESSFKE